MKIAFNLLPYGDYSHCGAAYYLKNIIMLLKDMPTKYQIVLICSDRDISAVFKAENSLTIIEIPGSWVKIRWKRAILEQILIPYYCIKYGIQCVISNYTVPLMAPCSKIVIVHDMLYRRFPKLLPFSKLIYWSIMVYFSIRYSAAIITVSQFSANEICAFYPKARDRIFITSESIRSTLSLKQKRESFPELARKPYLLCVSAFYKHKNLRNLIKAFASLSNDLKDLSLVLVGSILTPELRKERDILQGMVSDFALSARVQFKYNVTDEWLANLYQNASAFVLPSLYEGFCLPIIESQYFGCPVLCSDLPIFREVAGSAAIRFDSSSVDSIRKAILDLMIDQNLRKQLVIDGYSNIKRYTWEFSVARFSEAINFSISGISL
ncbi:MAG: glycosyltransferase family 4 protein [Candidatus Margulisbacteria bacterium]|nr:glycosyltransferase family 4 protein [Candidatus Margulisiibacteriota bacterium]